MRLALALIAWIVPAAERASWRREWEAEFAFASGPRAPRPGDSASSLWRRRRLIAAVQHAFWLRRQWLSLDSLAQDLRHALRALAHRRGFVTAAVLTLAIGVGGTTVMFGTLRAVLWRPLPFPHPQELTMVSLATAAAPGVASPNSVSPPDFRDWRAQGSSFASMAAIRDDGFALTGGGAEAAQVSGNSVTGAFFDLLGVPAQAGRTLGEADAALGAPAAAVISNTLWRSRFGGDPAVVGRAIVIDGVSTEVVGVMPASFDFPIGAEVWAPLQFTDRDLSASQRGAHYLTAIGRMQPGVAVASATSEMGAIARRLAASLPKTSHPTTISVVPLREAILDDDVRPAMQLLFGAVTLVFLIACVNVAGLVMGRAMDRGSDLALRAALGASRGRLVRGLFVESALIALAGGAAGIAAAAVGVRAVAALDAVDIPLLDRTQIDLPVALFTAAVTAMAAVLFGTVPAMAASKAGIASAGSAGARTTVGRRRMRARSLLVATEMALAAALLVGAGLLGRSVLALTRVDLGFDPDHVQTLSVSLPSASYPSPDQRARFVRDLIDRVSARGDVDSAAAIFGVPLSSFGYFMSISERDGAQPAPDEARRLSVELRAVTPGYFRTMGIPVIGGRDFNAGDRGGSMPVAVVNQSAARLLWPDASPVGHHATTGGRLVRDGNRAGGEVVGLVGDVHDTGPASRPRPTVYVPHAQAPTEFLTVVIKPRGSSDVIAATRAVVASMDPNLPVFRVRTMEQFVSRVLALPRFYLSLIALFAAIALALSAVGVYGAMAQSVGARTREIGIRLALGATPSGVVRLIVRQTAVLAACGLGAGILLSRLAKPALTSVLFGVRPVDTATYALVAAVIFSVAIIAAWLPARRASKVDPVTTLRAN